MKLKLIMVCLVSVSLASCYTENKASNQADRAHLKYPDLMAQKSRVWFPVTITSSVVDSSAYKAWLKEQQAINDDFLIDQEETETALKDTVIDVWEDSAKITKLNGQVKELKKLIVRKDSTIKNLKFRLEHVPPIVNIQSKEDSSKMQLIWAENKQFRDEAADLRAQLRTKKIWIKVFAVAAGVLAFSMVILFLFNRKKSTENGKDNATGQQTFGAGN